MAQPSNTLRIGNAIFQADHIRRYSSKFMDKQKYQDLLENKSIINYISEYYWWYRIDQDETQNIEITTQILDTLSIIKQSLCMSFVFIRTQNVSILKTIKSIKFIQLQNLLLKNNRISNIQDLSFLDCPILKTLTLQNNYISKIQSLNKITFPQLVLYNFGSNMLNDVKINKFNIACDQQNRVQLILFDTSRCIDHKKFLPEYDCSKQKILKIDFYAKLNINLDFQSLNQFYKNNWGQIQQGDQKNAIKLIKSIYGNKVVNSLRRKFNKNTNLFKLFDL